MTRETETVPASASLSLPPHNRVAMSMQSRAPCLDTGLPIKGLSHNTMLENSMSRWAVAGGTSPGSTIIKPFMSMLFDVCTSLQKRS